MLRRSSQSYYTQYICWRCLCLGPAAEGALRAPRPRTAPGPSPALAAVSRARPRILARHSQGGLLPQHHHQHQCRSLSTADQSPASAPEQLTLDDLDAASRRARQLRSDSLESGIRQRLRKWEAENPAPAVALLRDEPASGDAANVLTKSRSEFEFKLEVAADDEDAARPHFDELDNGVDLGQASALQAGDLVEVASGAGKIRLLAVCLGNFNGQLHFYTNTGKWFTSRTLSTGFVVKNFVQDPAELRAVVDAIPSLSPSSTVLNELQDLNAGPSRDLAASLIRKMHTFQSAARLVHQTYVERLSRAHSQLGSAERLLSLREIADALLPASLKRNKGVFPPEALYAVYSVVEEDDVAFRALDRAPRRDGSCVFLLHSAEVQENVRLVEQLVRDYYESISGHSTPLSATGVATGVAAKLDAFLQEARNLIDQARTERPWLPHGMVGPCQKDGSAPSELHVPRWSETSLSIIKFMQHWAASSGFRPGSRCHWIGASILRAVRRYEDALLDHSTGWTFLQEIGWIPPWDLRARHALRLPALPLHRHPALLPPPGPESAGLSLAPDRLAHLRQDFARSTVYCIDSADTLDVDDGISLEPLGNGEHWIHVHVADPASRILPDSPLAAQAASRVQTSYLGGFNLRMLDGDHVREAFSLGPNQPCLTFSARVSETGQLLDSKVTPGVLRDVVYITPEDASSICDDADSSSVPTTVLEVGIPPPKDTAPVRRMTAAKELSRQQRAELRTLSKLATALQHTRLANGAIPYHLPRPQAKVSMHAVAPAASSDGSAFYRGDPYIHVSYAGQGSPLVNSLMQLAGEVAARWCYERDIPVPYRVQRVSSQNLDALRAFNQDVFYPQLLAGKRPSAEDWHTLRSLSGGHDVSTTPAPNLAMGLDLYTKVTSPLRRYPDLLVHWQIEAALLEEHRRGESLVVRKFHGAGAGAGTDGTATAHESTPPAKGKATKDSRNWLPFSQKQLEDNVLPQVRIRERHAKLLDQVDGNSQWILQALVRAWRFGEGSTQLPRSFLFTVVDVVGKRAAKGHIDWFDRPAMVDLEGLAGVVRIGNVRPGDVFKAELADVNVHTNQIRLKLLEKVQGMEGNK
ncbi:uncharacterized protein THITE_2113379 [Thermothielavioides terrestris NRRL 8126]|uniref:RNB domain-containing protein n=1 Tax=Thermothielavioides terrestris (strain ATCC 38088 / NRRL 8126) TaxID=578455 RepID=G2R2H6_THETT|nr:uncharacterized protein THITE_2113379 [Thermothielavioides terrestris NRRL 8126]AEO65849.1 hypothetical protein THITE_2113379 [Thermothielavioides terrestris NRRL 8126]